MSISFAAAEYDEIKKIATDKRVSIAWVVRDAVTSYYESMFALTETLTAVGRGLPRVLATRADVEGEWPECPLLTAIDTLHVGNP